jgi:uncharacterized protein (DUF1501 family)
MKIMKFFNFLIAAMLTIGLIACSDDSKEDATNDEATDQEQMQDAPDQQGQQQQMQQQNQQQMQQQDQQNTQVPPQDVKIASKADVVKFLKKAIAWIESDAFIDQMRRTVPKAQTQQENDRVMAENKKVEEKFVKMAEESGIPNQQSFQATMEKFKDDEEITKLQQQLNGLMQSKMQIIQQEMMQQQMQQQQQQNPQGQ